MREAFVGRLDDRGSFVWVHVLGGGLSLLCPSVLGMLVRVCRSGNVLGLFPACLCDFIQDNIADVLLGKVSFVEENEREDCAD